MAKKYAVIDQTTGDWFENVYNTEAEAIMAADREWGRMSSYDKKRRASFYVAECELDEYDCVDYDTVVVVKEYR